MQRFRAVREMEGGKEGVMAQGALIEKGGTLLSFLEKPKSESKGYSRQKFRQPQSLWLFSPQEKHNAKGKRAALLAACTLGYRDVLKRQGLLGREVRLEGP